MLHLDSSSQLPEIRAPYAKGQTLPPAKDAKRKTTKLIQVTSVESLTFEKFLCTDMKNFSAQVIQIHESVFTNDEYIVEIKISEIPAFRVGKTYDEFRAFYKALKLRFPNIKWPEFPPSFQLIKKFETRRTVFNQILGEISGITKLQDTYKKSILGIFYAFFLDQYITQVAKIEKAKRSKERNSEATKSIISNPPEGEAHEENESSRHSDESLHSHVEERSEISKDGSTVVEEGQGLSKSFVGDCDRKLSFMSTPIDESRQKRCNSFNSYSLPNLDTPKADHNLVEGVQNQMFEQDQSFRSHGDVNNVGLEAPKVDLRKYSIDEGGHLEKERMLSPNYASRNLDYSVGNSLGDFTKEATLLPKINIKTTVDSPPSEMGQAISGPNKKYSQSFIQPGSPKFRSSLRASPQPSPTNRKRNYSFREDDSKPQDALVTDVRQALKQEVIKVEQKKSMAKDVAVDSRKSVAVDINKYMEKMIPKFAGNIFIQISSETQWNKYFARIENSCLMLYPSILDNFPVHFIPCFRATAKYVERPLGDYLELSHHYDGEKFHIAIEPNSMDQDDLNDPTKNLRVWQAQLNFACENVTGLQLGEDNYFYAVGKFQLVVCDTLNIKGLPSRSSCYLRITHKPYVLQTSKALSSETMKWKQSFFIPICDVFFPITLELVCVYNDGWITESQKEEVICTAEIPVQDLISIGSYEILEEIVTFKYTDIKKAKILKGHNVSENDLAPPKIRLKFKNISSVKSYFAPPYGDYVEGVKMESDTFTKQYFKLSLARIRRIVSYMILVARDIRDIYHHKYPFFSYIIFLMITYFMATFHVADILPGFLILLAFICLYNHPKIEPKVKSLMDQYFFDDKYLNSFYRHPQIKTQFELELIETFNTEKWRHKLKDDESIVSQLKKAKKSIVILTIVLTKISGFCEKMKNIMIWQDPRRTLIFFAFTLIGYCVAAVVPMKLLILAGIWTKFIKGIYYFSNLRQKNRQAATTTINFIMKKYFTECHEQVHNNPTAPWPTNVNFNNLQKKMVEQLKNRLEVEVADDLLQTYKTPEELISALEACVMHLKFKKDAAEEASNEMMLKKDPKFKPANLLYFIMNIPSDYYRVIQPKIIQMKPKKQI